MLEPPFFSEVYIFYSGIYKFLKSNVLGRYGPGGRYKRGRHVTPPAKFTMQEAETMRRNCNSYFSQVKRDFPPNKRAASEMTPRYVVWYH